MAKILLVAIISALLTFTTHTSAADSLQCSGEVIWGGAKTMVHIEINLPKKIDEVASVPSFQGLAKSIPVGLGRINIHEVTGNIVQSRVNDFYVTSLDTGTITGFFLEGVLVYVVRFSPRAKVFSCFDSFRERIIAGTCQ